jgi:hypothetical protein
MPFQPTDELVMRLTVNEWNQVLSQLQEGPWKIVHPLIGKMQAQAQQQQLQAAAQPNPNGAYAEGEVQPTVIVPRGDLN